MSLRPTFPDPLTIQPLSLPHKQTFILLHGRGSSAANFGPALLSTQIPILTPTSSLASPWLPSALQSHFPHALFIFPNAPRTRATCYRRSRINQWFDCWHVNEDADAQAWLQVDGLRETALYLHGLVRAEAAAVGGLGNVVLGGISQGCAASLVAGLLLEADPAGEERLGAFVGMCGWLPFRSLVGTVEGDADSNVADEGGFDPFERTGSDEQLRDSATVDRVDCARSGPLNSISRLREELEMPCSASSPTYPPIARTPVFMGHGVEDDKVPIGLGRETAERISSAGIPVCWHEYQELGHWFSSAMLADIVHFLKQRSGWDNCPSPKGG